MKRSLEIKIADHRLIKLADSLLENGGVEVVRADRLLSKLQVRKTTPTEIKRLLKGVVKIRTITDGFSF